MKLIKLACCMAFLACASGCAHNSIQFSDGLGMELGFVPENYSFAINFRYGKILSAVVKEKTEVELNTAVANKTGFDGSTNDAAIVSSDLGTNTRLYIKTGAQTTGYGVELEKAKYCASEK